MRSLRGLRLNPDRLAAWLILASTLAMAAALGSPEEDAISEAEIVEARDLRGEAARMERERLPMLLLVSQHHCPYCTRIKNEILRPMVKSGDYEGRVLIREIFIDLDTRVIDFSGRERASADFAHAYGVDLTPTLLFLDSGGRELSKRLIGLYTVEMFSFYVDSALDDAIAKLR